jgi:hypothetical protein
MNTADSATVVLAFMVGFVVGGLVLMLIASRFM